MIDPVIIGNAALHLGDCRNVLRAMDDASVDSIVTDPPYELGFMGKGWDRSGVAFDVELWREVLRVSKPGAHLLAFGGTRTHHRMMCAIEDAGWELRDTIMWVYGSGFPKSHNLGDGRGTALKPAWEPIIMARKPLIGSVAMNVLAHGTGALNIELCRIHASEVDQKEKMGRSGGHASYGPLDSNVALGKGLGRPLGEMWVPSTSGRWPANLIHDGSDEVVAGFPDGAGANSVGTAGRSYEMHNIVYSKFGSTKPFEVGDGKGSAARFFYCAKASKSDREAGCEELPLRAGGMVSNTSGQHITRRDGGAPGSVRNNHPTVKPTDLMRYLCRLATPPAGLILDPFAGSGSTGKGAALEGFRFVGIEQEAGYFDIACRRIEDAQRQERLIA